MLADAWREVRYHRGRVVATLIAIAITVGFMVAVSSLLTTAQHGIGAQLAVSASKADVVAQVQDSKAKSAKLSALINSVPGVAHSQFLANSWSDLSANGKSTAVEVWTLPDPEFRWMALTSGAWPSKDGQLAISKATATKFGVKVGDQIGVSGLGQTSTRATISGITNEPSGLFVERSYVTAAEMDKAVSSNSPTGGASGNWNIKVADGADISTVIAAVDKVLQPYAEQMGTETGTVSSIKVLTGSDVLTQSVNQVSHNFQALRYILLAFTGIAAVVGIIIIANTFTILLTQRRRQIGLLRAVGATGSQVRRKLLAEAMILGVFGSLLGVLLGLGVTLIGAWWGKLLFYGMEIPWATVALEFGIGVLLTVLAALAPSARATRVAPMEALRPVQTVEAIKRASRVRLVLCLLVTAAGVALAAVSKVSSSSQILWAVGGAMLVSLGVLFGAPLYVPWVLRALSRVIHPAGSAARLAGSNVRRNPARAAATATALMLAVGLIVTLQVGTATLRNSMLTAIAERYPIDLQVTTSASGLDNNGRDAAWLPAKLPAALDKVQQVSHSATVSGGGVSTKDGESYTGLVWNPSVLNIKGAPAQPAAGHILVSYDTMLAKQTQLVMLTADGKDKTFSISSSPAVGYNQLMIAPQDASVLIKQVQPVAVWMTLADRNDLSTDLAAVNKALEPYMPGLTTTGSAQESATITKVLDILLMVVTGLLGVAVLIALIGVGNTLGLSVIERRRESALLRAMGMQKRDLRLMLLWEALLLALAGVVVGVLAGVFFGWLGISAVLKQIGSRFVTMHFAIDVWQTLGMVAVALLAAALASVLPGRRAASAPPVAALADE